MKLITKKNISIALALTMAMCIITSAKADSNTLPEKRSAVFVHSAELVEFVDEYFENMEANPSLEIVETVKLFNEDGQLIFEGEVEDMEENIAQQFNKAEFLSQMGGAEYHKILQ